jgi:hypothetical protein
VREGGKDEGRKEPSPLKKLARKHDARGSVTERCVQWCSVAHGSPLGTLPGSD